MAPPSWFATRMESIRRTPCSAPCMFSKNTITPPKLCLRSRFWISGLSSVTFFAESPVPQVLKRSIIICVTFWTVDISWTVFLILLCALPGSEQPASARQRTMHTARASASALILFFPVVFIDFPLLKCDETVDRVLLRDALLIY